MEEQKVSGVNTSASLKQKTAKGLLWGAVNNGLTQLLGMLFGIYLARMLSPEDYGLMGMLSLFTGLSITFIESGFTSALVNRKEFRHEEFNSVFWFNIGMGALLYAVLFFLAPLIAGFYGRPELIPLSRVVFLGFLFGSFSVAQNAYLFKNLLVKQRAKIELTALVVSLLVALVLARCGFGYWSLAVQSTLYMLVASLLRWKLTPWRPSWSFSFAPVKEMFGFSSRILITLAAWQTSLNLFSVLLGRYYNATQVGYYSQGWKWMNMGQQTLGGMMSGVAQPVFVEAGADKERLLWVFRKMNRFGACLSFPLMLGLAFVGREFIVIAIGEKWLPAVPFLQLFCFWGAIVYLWNLYTYLLLSFGKSSLYMWAHILMVAIQLLVVALLYRFGIYPMVVGYVASIYLSLLFVHYHIQKQIPLRACMVLNDLLPYLVITVVSLAAAWGASLLVENIYLLLAVKVGVAAGVYLVILWRSNSVLFREMVAFAVTKFRPVS